MKFIVRKREILISILVIGIFVAWGFLGGSSSVFLMENWFYIILYHG